MSSLQPSPTKTWTIVCFLTDDTVEAVPTRWITGDDCLWPAVTKEKLYSLIRKCDFNSCWPSHKVRPFRNATYDDYALARRKASKAEITSDLNTDAEAYDGVEMTTSKRLRKPKVLSSSDESSDDDKPPKKNVKKCKLKVQKLPPPPTWTDTEMSDHEIMQSDKSLYVEDKVEENANNLQDIIPSTSNLKRTPLEEIQHNLKISTTQSTSVNSSGNKQTCCCNPKIMYNIQALLIEINSKLSKYTTHGTELEQVDNTNILEKSKLQFPIESDENFNILQEFLTIFENYSELVNFFAKIGGSSHYEFIRRCVAPILHDNLAEQFSFLGKKGKKIFGTTALAKAIIDAAQISGQSQSRKESEQKIGDWLRRAKERKLRLKKH